MDLFKSIKTETSFREGISRLYPHIKIERSGKHDRIRCPFHDDQDPSLVLYQSSYFCFGCGSGGDLVDFVGTLDGLKPIDAAKKIAREFGIPTNGPSNPSAVQAQYRKKQQRDQEKQLQRAFETWEKQTFIDLCQWRDEVQSMFDDKVFDLDPVELEMVHRLPEVEHLIQIFVSGSEGDRLGIFKSYLNSQTGGAKNEPAK